MCKSYLQLFKNKFENHFYHNRIPKFKFNKFQKPFKKNLNLQFTQFLPSPITNYVRYSFNLFFIFLIIWTNNSQTIQMI